MAGLVARLRLFVDRFRALKGIPEMCDLAWDLCEENERLSRENTYLRKAVEVGLDWMECDLYCHGPGPCGGYQGRVDTMKKVLANEPVGHWDL